MTKKLKPPRWGSQEWIDQAREFLKPTVVELNHVPNWLRLRLIKHFKIPREYHSGHQSLYYAASESFHPNRGTDWLDHWGSTTIYDRSCFVSEPYSLNTQDKDLIDLFANRARLTVFYSANSYWFPSQSLRIGFLPDQE